MTSTLSVTRLQKSPLILASKSRARKSLLRDAGLNFACVDSEVDEAVLKADFRDLSPKELVRALAKSKALVVARRQPDAWVVAGDQILLVEGRVMNKPTGRVGAIARLMDLRGKAHTLMTATVLYRGEACLFSTVDQATLVLDYLSHGAIRAYVDRERSWDSVTGYKIEGSGREMFRRVEGEEEIIMGLNVKALKDLVYGN